MEHEVGSVGSHRPNGSTGYVVSGDVNLFYRKFGVPGRAPILIFHGAQYYDSADWIEVGSLLARDREVVAFDARGYGQSSWSLSKNYSIDASVDDVVNLLDHLGWRRAIFMGHSRGGAFALLMGSRFPERTDGVILIDRPMHSPIGHPSHGGPAVGKRPHLYPTVEAAIEDMSRDARVPIGSAERARLDYILKPVEGGYIFRHRDPDYNNTIPLGDAKCAPRFIVDDLWLELKRVKQPLLIVYGTQSDRYPPSSLERLASQFPGVRVVGVESGHDVAVGAPAELITHVQQFLSERIDTVPK